MNTNNTKSNSSAAIIIVIFFIFLFIGILSSDSSPSSRSRSTSYLNGYEVLNSNDESFSDYVKRVDPELYNDMSNRYNEATRNYK